jgi:tripartite-type tricarboxylate transporter receptor subunit TctC
MKMSGMQMVHGPYKGEPQAIIDTLSGQTHFMFGTQGTLLPFIKKGTLLPLATINTPDGKRSAMLPDVPTLGEAGLPNFSMVSFAALVGPPKMPRAIVDRLNRELHAVLQEPDVRHEVNRIGFNISVSSPEELTAIMKEQLSVVRAIVRELNLQTD